ncbi:hypothetical protein ACX80N_10655 [Arthrobacter sp. MDT2-16]
MRSDHLEQVAAIAHSTGFTVDAEPPAELQQAVASAVSHGEPLAVVAAVADMPSLAVLDALDALLPNTA